MTDIFTNGLTEIIRVMDDGTELNAYVLSAAACEKLYKGFKERLKAEAVINVWPEGLK